MPPRRQQQLATSNTLPCCCTFEPHRHENRSIPLGHTHRWMEASTGTEPRGALAAFKHFFQQVYDLIRAESGSAGDDADAEAFFADVLVRGCIWVDDSPPPKTPEATCLVAYIHTCQLLFPRFQRDPLFLPWGDIRRIVDVFITDPEQGDYGWSPVLTPNFIQAILRQGFIPLCDGLTEGNTEFVGDSEFEPKPLRLKMPPPPRTRRGDVEEEENRIDIASQWHPRKKPATTTNTHTAAAGTQALVFLLPKLNRERCVMAPKDIHISKNTMKRARRFEMTTNQRFEEVTNRFLCHSMPGASRVHSSAWRQLAVSSSPALPRCTSPPRGSSREFPSV